jgi:hypothetical protein
LSAEPSSISRVKCRQIAEGDLDALSGMLTDGFRIHPRDFWNDSLARIAARPPIQDMPRIGYTLENESGLVGVILTLWSKRGDEMVCALSSWYVDRPYRRPHAASLPVTATSIDGPLYLNTSPADHTRKSMASMGWTQYNFGRSVAFPALTWGMGKVSEDIPEDLPERDLLEDHRAWGCISVVCAKKNAISPFVFRARSVTPLKIPIMELIYCRDTSDFESCGGALGRWFLGRGSFGFILDGRVKGMPSVYAEGKEPRLYKGPRAPKLNDLAYTEKALLG